MLSRIRNVINNLKTKKKVTHNAPLRREVVEPFIANLLEINRLSSTPPKTKKMASFHAKTAGGPKA